MVLRLFDRHGRLACAGVAAVWLLLLPGPPPSAQPDPEEPPPAEPGPGAIESAPWPLERSPEPSPPEERPNTTAAGAVRTFMASRDYRKLRELRSVMAPALRRRFEYNSAPFNGKQGVRLSAFDYDANDLTGDSRGHADRYTVSVRSLWEDQGEVVESRVETVQVARQQDGLWRVAQLNPVESEHLRFTEAVPGVTTLRMVLRAWDRGKLDVAKRHLSRAFLRRYDGREDALRDLIVGARNPCHTAFQILEVEPRGDDAATAKVQLFLASPGQPGPLDGETHTLQLARFGQRWLLDAWD